MSWEAQWCGDDEHNEFELRKWQHRVRVNTRERTCSCRKWQLTGLPCCHGIAAIQRKNEKPEDYVHHKLTIEAYNRTYQFHINSIPSQEYWEHHEGLPCLPPPYKRPIGRPSKKRKKDSSEQDSGSQYHAKRRYGQITCQTCKRVGHNSRTCPERSNGAAAQEEGIDEDEAREQEANWEETMEAAHAAHVADEENLTQNYPQSQPDENTEADLSTTTTAAPPNAATTPATSSGPAPPVAARPVEPTPPIPPTRGRGRTIRRGRPPTPTAPQTRVASHDAGSNCQIPATPTNAAGSSTGPGSMSQGPLGRPTLQAQYSASSRPPTVSRKTMAAASPATQSRFIGFMPTLSLKKKKPSASIKK
ncbi:flocculation protein FLO11-like [Arachis ipaensis]|uniref:flocculation protein FLO11-like n=1 Tax=Arachis ipaensis TaxID=130454 RepID=UPI000A2B2F4C|nr:flocculation protein FLO11-like [Arachis ipaensis]